MAFEAAKKLLADATLLHHPSPSAETKVTTDASGVAVGVKLEQLTIKGAWAPIAFFLRKLKVADREEIQCIRQGITRHIPGN